MHIFYECYTIFSKFPFENKLGQFNAQETECELWHTIYASIKDTVHMYEFLYSAYFVVYWQNLTRHRANVKCMKKHDWKQMHFGFGTW